MGADYHFELSAIISIFMGKGDVAVFGANAPLELFRLRGNLEVLIPN